MITIGDRCLTLNGNVELLRREELSDSMWLFAGRFKDLRHSEAGELQILVLEAAMATCLSSLNDPEQKEKIRHFFLADLNNYLDYLHRLSVEVQKDTVLQPNLLQHHTELTNEIVRKGHDLVEELNHKTLAQKIKQVFRMTAGHWAFQSLIIRHGFEKPRGYPGDYWLMESIYNNEFISQSPVGILFDHYYLRNPYAVAVRNRKDMTEKILIESLANFSFNEPIQILNLACGSSREIFELTHDPRLAGKRLVWTCLDHDDMALTFSRSRLDMIPKEWSVRYVNLDIIKAIESSDHSAQLLGKQHLIYSMGLADYLPDRILKKLVSFCFNLLSANGELIFAHKDREQDPFAPIPPDWFCDWRFARRSLAEFNRLIVESKVSGRAVRYDREPSQKIFFLKATKE